MVLLQQKKSKEVLHPLEMERELSMETSRRMECTHSDVQQ